MHLNVTSLTLSDIATARVTQARRFLHQIVQSYFSWSPFWVWLPYVFYYHRTNSVNKGFSPISFTSFDDGLPIYFDTSIWNNFVVVVEWSLSNQYKPSPFGSSLMLEGFEYKKGWFEQTKLENMIPRICVCIVKKAYVCFMCLHDCDENRCDLAQTIKNSSRRIGLCADLSFFRRLNTGF